MAIDQQMLHLTSDEATLADFPRIHGTVGFDGIDVRTLLAQTNMVTYDPSFGSTASCRSAITYVDGENGVLLHRGYPIDVLAEEATYLEVAHLLLFGDLPTETEFNGFNHDITYHTMVHEQLLRFFSGFPRDAHPMAVLLGVVGALSAFYPDSTDVFDAKHRLISIHRLLAKMPTLAAMAYKHSVGQPMVYPQNRFNYTENFLYMMFSVPAESGLCARAQCADDRAGRSRTECLDLDRPHGRLDARQSVRLRCGWHRFALGAHSRRSERSRRLDARPDRPQRKYPRVRRACQRPE